MSLSPQFLLKYSDLKKWEYKGSYSYNDGNNRISWLELGQVEMDLHTNLSINSPVLDILDYKETLYKAMQPNFKIENVSDDERYIISQCINKGYLTIIDNDGSVSPNFYVFTPAQRQEFENIIMGCYDEMKSRYGSIYFDIRKMCRACLPIQLDNYLDFISYFCLKYSHLFFTGFAFYDGKLFKPRNATDYTLQTLSMTISDEPIENIQKSTVKLIFNFPNK